MDNIIMRTRQKTLLAVSEKQENRKAKDEQNE
jgi:hypothetical protein